MSRAITSRRISLGGEPLRSAAGDGRRSYRAPGGRDRRQRRPRRKAAKAATATIPIVFFVAGDPVKLGLVASLTRPGGNLTGITNLGVELGPKRLELLHELVPAATSFAAARQSRPSPGAGNQSEAVQAAARALSCSFTSSTPAPRPTSTLSLQNSPSCAPAGSSSAPIRSSIPGANRLAALAARHAVPTIYQNREFAAAGGLTSYGASSEDRTARSASMRAGSQRREARRPAGAAANQVRADHQSQDREGARPHRTATLQAAADEVIE